MAGSVSLDSDYRFRGYSLSNGKPVGTAQISYDDLSGAYLNGTLTGVGSYGGVRLLGYQANAGYAHRVGSGLSLDAGLIHSLYRYRYYGTRYSASYTEAYIGANAHNLSARLSYAPHYFRDGVSTLYGELDGGFEPRPNWRISGHLGTLGYLTAPASSDRKTRYDWQVSASRQLGRFEVHTAVSGGGPRGPFLYGIHRSGTALTVGASLNF